MKKAFFALAVFFFAFLIFLFIGALGYYLYFNGLLLAAGTLEQIQRPLLFFAGIFAVWGTCAVFSLIPVIFYFIRFKTSAIWGVAVWCFLCLVVFVFLQPFSFIMKKKFSDFTAEYKLKNPVYVEDINTSIFTPGFFREFDDGIYYFKKVDKLNKNVTGIKLPVLSGYTSVKPAVILNNDTEVFRAISNESDPLIANTILLPKYASTCIVEVRALEAIAEKAFMRSEFRFSRRFLAEYSGFFSLALAFLGFFAFTAFSSWKLQNALLAVVSCAFVLHINFLVQCTGLLTNVRNFLSFLPPTVPNNFYVVAVNALIFTVLVTIGLLRKIRKSAEAESE